MVLGQRGSTAVLERPANVIRITEEPQESGGAGLARAKSSLTVIENPSLDGYLGILMAESTILYNDGKAFFDVYFIVADKDYKVVSRPLKQRGATTTTRQVGNQLLYLILDENKAAYPVASLVPHEHCGISPEEFHGFEVALRAGGLEGMVNGMAKLIGQKVDAFSLDNGKLVLPQNYLNTRLSLV